MQVGDIIAFAFALLAFGAFAAYFIARDKSYKQGYKDGYAKGYSDSQLRGFEDGYGQVLEELDEVA